MATHQRSDSEQDTPPGSDRSAQSSSTESAWSSDDVSSTDASSSAEESDGPKQRTQPRAPKATARTQPQQRMEPRPASAASGQSPSTSSALEAPAQAPLPPTGSYYEYAGQRVLVPQWPSVPLRNPQEINHTFSLLIRATITEFPSQGTGLGRGRGFRGLSDWGKELFLRVKAKVAALETTDPLSYAEVMASAPWIQGNTWTAVLWQKTSKQLEALARKAERALNPRKRARKADKPAKPAKQPTTRKKKPSPTAPATEDGAMSDPASDRQRTDTDSDTGQYGKSDAPRKRKKQQTPKQRPAKQPGRQPFAHDYSSHCAAAAAAAAAAFAVSVRENGGLGAEFEHDGVLVPVPKTWPDTFINTSQHPSRALSEIIMDVVGPNASNVRRPGQTYGYLRVAVGKGLSVEGKRILLTIKARVMALERDDPQAHREIMAASPWLDEPDSWPAHLWSKVKNKIVTISLNKGPKDSADPDTNTTDTYALALTSNGLHEVAAAEIAAIEQLCGADPTNPVDYEMGVNANARRKARDNTREDVSYTSDAEADAKIQIPGPGELFEFDGHSICVPDSWPDEQQGHGRGVYLAPALTQVIMGVLGDQYALSRSKGYKGHC